MFANFSPSFPIYPNIGKISLAICFIVVLTFALFLDYNSYEEFWIDADFDAIKELKLF